MFTTRGVAAALAVALAVAGSPLPAEADHDRNRIEQLMAGANGNPAVQFVELKMLADFQNCQGTATDSIQTPEPFCAESGPGASLRFFDAAGTQVQEFRFPGNTPVGLKDRRILIATAEFAALGTTPTPDFIMPPHVVPDSGMVCYTSRPGTLLTVDNCLHYGAFAGRAPDVGRPAPVLPIAGAVSLRRIHGDEPPDNSLDFALGTPTPTNNADQTGSVPVVPPKPPLTLAAATLPTSRSVQVNTAATAFATIINGGSMPALGCSIALGTGGIPAAFSYQPTDAQNQAMGPANTPVDIPANLGLQNFVIGVTSSAPIPPTDLVFTFDCTTSEPAAVISGVNTLLFSASATPVPDIVALAATADNDGIVKIPGAAGIGVFAVASVNVGAPGSITATADTGSAVLPVILSVCRTDPITAQCLSPPDASATADIGTGGTPTFSIFVTGTGVVPFDPAVHRVRVLFKDASNELRGATSVAVQTR